jgi:group I intron endonuclease
MLIYEALNLNNGRAYIGLTTLTLEKRKSSHLRSAKAGSNTYFHKALRKYGPEAFEWGVVLLTNSLEDLYKLEKMVIGLHEDWQLYNTSLGGEHSAYGLKHTPETKEICGEHAKRRWDGKRCFDKYPSWVFYLQNYKQAREYGVPKTTWYRHRVMS